MGRKKEKKFVKALACALCVLTLGEAGAGSGVLAAEKTPPVTKPVAQSAAEQPKEQQPEVPAPLPQMDMTGYELFFLGNTFTYNMPEETEEKAGFISAQSMPLKPINKSGDWYQIQYGPKQVWVKQAPGTVYVRQVPKMTGDTIPSSQNYMYLHHPLPVYKEADPESEKIAAPASQRLEVLAQQGTTWYKVKVNGREGWLYDDGGYMTKELGVKRINIQEALPLYQYPNPSSRNTGTWQKAGETVAYARMGDWYQVEQNGGFHWLYAPNGEVQPVYARFTDKKTVENGELGNALFMTPPPTRVETLTKRLVTDVRGQKERMFETVIIVPLAMVERGFSMMEYEVGDSPSLTGYLDDIFKPGDSIETLTKASLAAQQQMGDKQPINIILALPYPVEKKKVPFLNDNRVELQRQYIEKAVANWEKAKPEGLRLAGFYWTQESIPDNNKDVVKKVADLIHKKGYKMYWAPYLGATNAEKWKTLGIDFAWFQPNYYFADGRKKFRGVDMLGQAYTIARETGGGTMLEWDWSLRQKPENTTNLKAYLDRGKEFGANKPSMLVYDGIGGIDAALLHVNDRFSSIRKQLFDYLLEYK
ncbi:Bacterial SH3 domain protein [compost metagenome]